MPKDKRPRGAAGRQQAQGVKHPRKALYRARAHANPLSDSQWPVPARPSDYDWSDHFQEFFQAAKGTATPLNDFRSTDASEPADAAQPSSSTAAAPVLEPTTPSTSAVNSADPAPLAQDADSVQAQASSVEATDPQTLRQQQHEQAADSSQSDLQVRFADVGCGFGGLLVRLSPLYPDKLMVGMEIRDKVTNYVIERVSALRREQPGNFNNITALRTNAMRHLPNFFFKGQLHKLFFLFPPSLLSCIKQGISCGQTHGRCIARVLGFGICVRGETRLQGVTGFRDPHFKTANHRRRIIQTFLLAEYACILAVGGVLYTITDVQELGEWMRSKLDAHPLFQRISDEELDNDPAANLLTSASEEAQKVARNEGKTFRNVYRRIRDEDI